MYVDLDTINSIAKLIGSLLVIGGLLAAAYKFIEREHKQTLDIKAIRKEQQILCYGVRACLQGLSEQGCDGPVHEALEKLDKHLNESAHTEITE